MADEGGPHRRTFLAKRLDRARWWPVTLEATDDEVDATLQAAGFDPATKREMARRDPPRADPPPMPSLEESRWVRIMADVCADGVWNQAGESCLVDDLPVSPELRARLLAWQAVYDAHDDRDGPFLDLDAFAAEGHAIAQAVKAQLPDWTVLYFDESRMGGDRPRSAYEYEITQPSSDPA